jgi:uncharacterized DUF497 family protein
MAEPETAFTWDEAKSQTCFAERGFDFAYAAKLWDGPVMEREDRRLNYGEIRIQATGQIEGRRFVVVFTWRGSSRHIISARRAHQKEVLKWAD